MDSSENLFSKAARAWRSLLSPPCSPFLPIMLVFGTLCAVQALQLVTTLRQAGQIGGQVESLKRDLPRASIVNSKMLELSSDLLKLSRKSPAAAAIVRDFNIQIGQPAAPGKAGEQP